MARFFLRSTNCPDIILNPGKEIVLGRGPLTSIKDSRVSRQQMTVKLDDREVVVRQEGHNHSVVAGVALSAGERRTILPGDCLYLVEGQYQFKLVEDNRDIERSEEEELSSNISTSETTEKKTLKHGSSNNWNQGLLSSMTDPDLLVTSNTYIVTIKDKYPKAKHHYLVLPKKQLPNL